MKAPDEIHFQLNEAQTLFDIQLRIETEIEEVMAKLEKTHISTNKTTALIERLQSLQRKKKFYGVILTQRDEQIVMILQTVNFEKA